MAGQLCSRDRLTALFVESHASITTDIGHWQQKPVWEIKKNISSWFVPLFLFSPSSLSLVNASAETTALKQLWPPPWRITAALALWSLTAWYAAWPSLSLLPFKLTSTLLRSTNNVLLRSHYMYGPEAVYSWQPALLIPGSEEQKGDSGFVICRIQ